MLVQSRIVEAEVKEVGISVQTQALNVAPLTWAQKGERQTQYIFVFPWPGMFPIHQLMVILRAAYATSSLARRFSGDLCPWRAGGSWAWMLSIPARCSVGGYGSILTKFDGVRAILQFVCKDGLDQGVLGGENGPWRSSRRYRILGILVKRCVRVFTVNLFLLKIWRKAAS